MIEHLHHWIEAIRAFPSRSIAAVEGAAAGAGFSLALACDLIVAAEDARFVVSHGTARPVARRRRDLAPRRSAAAALVKRDRLARRADHGGAPARARLVGCVSLPGSALGRGAGARRAPRRRSRRTRSPASRSSSQQAPRPHARAAREPSATTSSTTCTTPTPAKGCRLSSTSTRRASAERAHDSIAVTQRQNMARAHSYNRGTGEHRFRLVVLHTLPVPARRDPARALVRRLQGRRADRRARRSGRGVDRLRQGRGARELDLDLRQAGHADLCRAGHLVRRRRDLRRRAAHARCLCAWRHHDPVRPRADLKKLCRSTSSSTKPCCACTPAPAPAVRRWSRTSTPCPCARGWPSRSCCWCAATACLAAASEMRIGLQLAQEELAQLLGASRQRVNQELKAMEREEVIRIEPAPPGRAAQPRRAACAYRRRRLQR